MIPEFKFEKEKVSLAMLFKFLHPPNLEHSDINGRLDIFAKYGPCLNRHSVDSSFCKICARKGKKLIKHKIAQTRAAEEERLGLNSEKQLKFESRRKKTLNGKSSHRIFLSPVSVLEEDDIVEIWGDLCYKCREHCETHVNLISGRENQHIMTDQEISCMIEQENREDLLNVLLVRTNFTLE